MDSIENPILYIEEFGSAPDLAHRRRVPDAAMVYRMPDGELWHARGGLTAGELLWRKPREVYLVDVQPHIVDIDCIVPLGQNDDVAGVRFGAVWQVVDPVAAVANRMTQPLSLGEMATAAWLNTRLDASAVTTKAGLFGAISGLLPERLDLQGGLRVDLGSIRSVSDASPDGYSYLNLLEELLGRDPHQGWRAHYDVAQRGRLSLADISSMDDDDVTLLREALERYGELVDRLGDLMPFRGGAEL